MIYLWDDFSLDVAAHRLVGPDGEVHLEPQAFDVLAFLVQERDRVVPKTEILDSVWGDQFVSESAMTTRIKQVRQSLGDDGRTQKYVRTVHGRGYQFVGDLTSVASPTPATPAPLVASTAPNLAVDIAVDDEFPFVGRRNELEAIDAVLAFEQGANGKVFIGGAPGSGKSRLAIEVLRDAAQNGTTVCAGRCEASVTSSLQAVRDAVAQLGANNPNELPRWSNGNESQLLSLIPSFVNHLSADPIPVDGYAGIDVLLTFFERVVAGGRLIILIDDLQWSDDPTRTFLARLHRRLAGKKVATMATFRSARSDLPDEVHAWIQAECRSNPSIRMALDNLDDDAALDLIAAVTGDPLGSDGHKLVVTTAGHSLFLTESLRDLALGEGTAQSVSELISRRLARQDEEVQQVIEAAAILGPEFSFSIAATAAGLQLERALGAVDNAIDAELLHETASPERFRFSHQLVPEAIAAGLTRSRRASLHQACADALRSQGADDAEVAFHRLGAIPLVPMDDAISESRAAAAAARDANQFDQAHRLLEAILLVEPQSRVRAEVLLEIGQVVNLMGTPALAIASLDQVIEIARKNGWPDLFVAAALAHWNRSPFRKPNDVSTLKVLAEADALLGDTPSADKARVIAKTSVFNIFRLPLSERTVQIDRAMAMADAVGTTDAQRLELLEWRHITFSCPAGSAQLDDLDRELERLREASDTYFTDAAAPETSALMHGRGEELRRITLRDDERMQAQPIAEWRDLTTRSMFASEQPLLTQSPATCDRLAAVVS